MGSSHEKWDFLYETKDEAIERLEGELSEMTEQRNKCVDLLWDLNQITKTALHHEHHDLIDRTKDIIEEMFEGDAEDENLDDIQKP